MSTFEKYVKVSDWKLVSSSPFGEPYHTSTVQTAEITFETTYTAVITYDKR